MTPHEVIKDSLEKLPDLTCINGAMSFGTVETPCSGRETGECGSRCQNEQTYDEAMKELVEHIQSSQLSLPLSVKEMVDKMVVNTPNEVALLNKELPTTLQTNYYNQAVGYVDAIGDLQSLLDSEINKIKEL